ncbi:MAG: dihydropteroate synthase [Deltaproteobacteria bacterium]|nr:dihydropteroate synthase [Deltaproteobacteria bacterium]
MLIVGERINSSRESMAQAIAARDTGFIQNEVTIQAEAGADYIDVNAGTFLGEELECLKWVVRVVQDACERPLCIDSPDPRVIEGVLPLVKGSPMINSITLEPMRLKGILPLVAEHAARVIGLCQSEDTMAATTEDKLRLAGQLVESVTKAGIPLDSLYIDPLVYPLSTHPESAVATMEAIERIMKEFPGVHTICGLTNISFGLPKRKLINRTFLVAAMARGLDAVILDPTDTALFGTLRAALAVVAKDDYCMDYIAAFRQGRLA